MDASILEPVGSVRGDEHEAEGACVWRDCSWYVLDQSSADAGVGITCHQVGACG
jgi:hypothetical protein